ncbi:MAG: glycerol kinase GlpK [Clostridia bacterium]|nr:glycerol kinase GlpK [Clostridia bacterium]
MKRYIIGLDAGTTSVRSVVYDLKTHKIVALKRAKIRQYYPHKGWVEQDAEEIFFMLKNTLEDVISEMDRPLDEYVGIGLTNQRETVVAFNKESLKPSHKAIVWQDRRTNDFVDAIPQKIKTKIKEKTGLIPDAYFSASKMKWIKDNVKRASDLDASKKLWIGTLDSYLACKFTGNFVTDTTNASRTMLFNIHTMDWDDELLKYFGISRNNLPKVVSNSEFIGEVKDIGLPLLSIIGDQQSSLVGNGCLSPGMAKNTYGTGCFIMLNTGSKPVSSPKILTTIGYTIGHQTTYALEGSVFSACSALNWTKQNLDIAEDFESLDKKMKALGDTSGVYFVPAFTGLGAPYWDSSAEALITGMTFDTNKYTIMRAVYESMAYNTKAIIDEMTKSNHISLSELRIDGGGSNSKFLAEFQANMLEKNVLTGDSSEATVLGCIYLAGLAAGVLDREKITKLTSPTKCYSPAMDKSTINTLYSGWLKAIKKSTNQ